MKKDRQDKNDDEKIDELEEIEDVDAPRKKVPPKSSRSRLDTPKSKDRRKRSDDEEEIDDVEEVDQPRKRAPKDSRVYVHTDCGARTEISGADYDHITDPFWFCTGTYCCECQKHVSLGDVYWKNTKESVADYRRRMRRKTPTFLKVWHYGLGPGLGSIFGGLIGFAVGILTPGRTNGLWYFILIGALIGIGVLWLVGKFLLNRIFGIDYRRMR